MKVEMAKKKDQIGENFSGSFLVAIKCNFILDFAVANCPNILLENTIY
jgi:hypothetical protein